MTIGRLTQTLTDAARCGVYRATERTEVDAAARGTRLDLAHVLLDGAQDKEALLARLAESLAFPAWFGGNWDALEDCLGDLSWRPGEGHVLVLEGHEDVAQDDLGMLLDVLQSAAAFWAQRRRPFFAVFVDPGHALALPELSRRESA